MFPAQLQTYRHTHMYTHRPIFKKKLFLDSEDFKTKKIRWKFDIESFDQMQHSLPNSNRVMTVKNLKNAYHFNLFTFLSTQADTIVPDLLGNWKILSKIVSTWEFYGLLKENRIITTSYLILIILCTILMVILQAHTK